MPDISAHTQSPTITAIEAQAETQERRGHYPYLRGSGIGDPCERKLWYAWRWVYPQERFEGRMLRLFATGHREEDRLIEDLRAVGVEVVATDAGGGQVRVEALDGHFRGHLDGIAIGILEAPKTPHLLEIKTHNAKSFAQLVKHGVNEAQPKHMVQMQVYMHLRGLLRAFYFAKCKDDDRLYAERIEYDVERATRIMAKAERIRDTRRAPAQIAPADSHTCRFCPHRDGCHSLAPAPVEMNCRTCIHSTPVPGSWHCTLHDTPLSIDSQRAGCPHHEVLEIA